MLVITKDVNWQESENRPISQHPEVPGYVLVGSIMPFIASRKYFNVSSAKGVSAADTGRLINIVDA